MSAWRRACERRRRGTRPLRPRRVARRTCIPGCSGRGEPPAPHDRPLGLAGRANDPLVFPRTHQTDRSVPPSAVACQLLLTYSTNHGYLVSPEQSIASLNFRRKLRSIEGVRHSQARLQRVCCGRSCRRCVGAEGAGRIFGRQHIRGSQRGHVLSRNILFMFGTGLFPGAP